MESELHFGFAEQTDAVSGGWLQGRYHSEDGDTVADMLSFKSVFEINPFEVGVGQADDVLRIMRSCGFGDVEITPDLNGIPRVVSGILCTEV